ncbi:MAG: hypothetical protein DMG36_07870, partial [Acidobacteria bacterium]
GDASSPNSTVAPVPVGTSPQVSTDAPVHLRYRGLGADGSISSVECSSKPELFINVNLENGPVTFHAADAGKIRLTWADGTAEPSMSSCSQWKGRRVKVWFTPASGKEYAGEIISLYFF